MKNLGVLFLLLMVVTSLADGPARWSRHHRAEPNGPWLGVKTMWMEKATAAQLNDVPEGFGLLIDSVEPASPAFEAGLKSLDVIWKFDDQLIANKSQLLALMKMTGIGKEGALTISRAGESLVLPVTIGMRPESGEELAEAATEVLMPPLPGSIVRQLDLGKRSGFIEEGGVIVSVSRKVEGFGYQVSKGEELVEEGVLQGEDIESWPAIIDEKTRRKLQALIQSLANAEQREASAQRVPRVRRVPVPKEAPKK